jgi:RecB family endonuclease NucS
MDIDDDGVLNFGDPSVWMLKPDFAYRVALDNIFRTVQWNAPEEARQAIAEHYQLIVEVRKRSKAKISTKRGSRNGKSSRPATNNWPSA